jgi:glycerophosphoryl diester phosphodiesterase
MRKVFASHRLPLPTMNGPIRPFTALAALALIAAPIVLAAAPADAAVPDATRCLVAAHRGNTGVANTTATENTLTAFHRAVSAHSDILEMDASATSDDSVVLMHDATVDRTTNGTGTTRSKTITQVKALATDDHKSGRFDAAGKPIAGAGGVPTLSAVIAYAKAQHRPVLLEIKTPGGTAWYQRLARNVNSYPGGVIMQSFNRPELDKSKPLMPGVPMTLVSTTEVAASTLAGLAGIVIQQAALSTSYRSSLDAANLQIHPWVENTSTTWSRDLGHVSSIITNTPAALAAFRAKVPGCPQFTG